MARTKALEPFGGRFWCARRVGITKSTCQDFSVEMTLLASSGVASRRMSPPQLRCRSHRAPPKSHAIEAKTPWQLLVQRPSAWSPAAAAALPTVYTTVDVAFAELAKLKKGEKAEATLCYTRLHVQSVICSMSVASAQMPSTCVHMSHGQNSL